MYNQVPNNYSYQPYNPYGMMNRGDVSLMQQQSQPQQQMPQLKGRPVASVEEVRAAQVDFDGSLFVFPNIANQKIYTKQINLDGTVSLNTYALVKEAEPASDIYVTRKEFDDMMNKIKSYLNNQSSVQNQNQVQMEQQRPQSPQQSTSFVANF